MTQQRARSQEEEEEQSKKESVKSDEWQQLKGDQTKKYIYIWAFIIIGDNKQQNNYQGDQYEGKVFGKKQDDLQSMKSFQSDTGSLRTTSTNF